MKKRTSILACLILCSGQIFLNAQKYESAGAYMTAIGLHHKDITSNTWNYVKSTAHSKNGKKIDARRQELLKSILEAKNNMAKMPGYDGDVSYRDSAVTFLSLNFKVLNEDYGEILNMEEIAEQSYDLMEAYMLAKEKANDKLKKASVNLQKAQKSFAEAHNINLMEGEKSKIEEKLEKAGAAMKYYNQVYLIFFKSYKEELYLLNALNTNDLNALEQTKSSLISFSNEGIKELQKLGNYKTDATIKEACKKMLTFFQQEAENDVPIYTNFFLKKENFEKIKSAFDKKKSSDKTKEDIAQFNEAVNALNNASDAFNSTNDKLNNLRLTLLNEWNEKVQKFMKIHVPM